MVLILQGLSVKSNSFNDHNFRILYNYIIPDSLLEGMRGHECSEGIVFYNIFRFRDWKGCNVIRAHDTI